MGLIQEEDQRRFFNNIALEGLHKYLHPLTGFIQDEQVIYLYENFLAAQALLSSKLKENIEKARDFLDRLLYFQNPQGLFPKALHEFPAGSTEGYQLDLAFILYNMHSHYHSALGEKLKDRLKTALNNLFLALDTNAPYSFEKMQARFIVFKDLFENKVPQFDYPEKKMTSKYLGEKLFLAQETPSYEQLLAQLAPYWHPLFYTYTGPLLDESYRQGQPELSIFDYYMSSAYKTYFSKLHQKNFLQLQGTLVRYAPSTFEFLESLIEGFYKDYPYTLINASKVSWFFFNDYSSMDEPKGLHLFRCLFKSLDHLYSFVCHSKVKHLKSEFSKNALIIDFTYFALFPEEVKQQNELEFFMSLGDDLQVLVDGKKASLFRLGSILEFKTQEATLRCTFSSDSKDAQIVGHLLYGNRPSSIESHSVDAKAYDQKIVLRTLRRGNDCKIRLHLEFV